MKDDDLCFIEKLEVVCKHVGFGSVVRRKTNG